MRMMTDAQLGRIKKSPENVFILPSTKGGRGILRLDMECGWVEFDAVDYGFRLDQVAKKVSVGEAVRSGRNG